MQKSKLLYIYFENKIIYAYFIIKKDGKSISAADINKDKNDDGGISTIDINKDKNTSNNTYTINIDKDKKIDAGSSADIISIDIYKNVGNKSDDNFADRISRNIKKKLKISKSKVFIAIINYKKSYLPKNILIIKLFYTLFIAF